MPRGHTAPVVIGIIGPWPDGLGDDTNLNEFRQRDRSGSRCQPAAFQADRQLYKRLF